MFSGRKDINDIVKSLNPLKNDKEEKKYFLTRGYIASKIIRVFDLLKNHFPVKKHLNILSLACGIPDELIALKAFYQNQGTTFNYTGIEINDELNVQMRESFAPISDNFQLLTCDGSYIDTLKKGLEEAKCLPENGFDLVIMRHPDVLTRSRCAVFHRMIEDVVPFFSSKDSVTFFSHYALQEAMITKELTDRSGVYFKPEKGGNFCELDIKDAEIYIDGILFKPELYSIILKCFGHALINHATAEEKSSASYVDVTYKKEALDYVKRLQTMLNVPGEKTPLMRHDKSLSQVSFASFWLRQLSSDAIAELSRELKTSKSRLTF